MRLSIQVACALILTLCAACSSLGFVTPQTFDERLAAAYSTNTAIRNAATSSLQSGALTADDAEYALQTTRQNRTYLDAARAVAGQGDMATAEGRLYLVTSALTGLRNYLAANGVKTP